MSRSPLLQSTLDRILKARVYDVAIETALERAPRLSQRLRAEFFFEKGRQSARVLI
jgi:threonine dehydratase